MVYRDVSEAYWKTGDRPRAIAVIKEGRTAGADEWLFSASAAKVTMSIPSGTKTARRIGELRWIRKERLRPPGSPQAPDTRASKFQKPLWAAAAS